MRIIFFVFLLLIVKIDLIAQKKIDPLQRTQYFNNHPFYVSILSSDFTKIKPDKVELITQLNNAVNRNIKFAIDSFWDLSNSVHFVESDKIKGLKKTEPDAVFFEFGSYENKLLFINVEIPNKKEYLSNVVGGHVILDTNLLNIIEEIRFLRLEILNGERINRKDLPAKVILIDKIEPEDKNEKDFRSQVKVQFGTNVAEVDKNDLLQVVLTKDARFVYVNRLSIINAEDGSVIPL